MPQELEDFHKIYGSRIVADILWRKAPEEPALSKYMGRNTDPEDMTVNDAIERTVSYIQACSDPFASFLDERCRSIGGRICVATVTRNGFQWAPGFAPVI